MENEKVKRCQFYGQLYTGENAEMKTTSFRAPVGFLKDIATVCQFHEGEAGREFARAMRTDVKPMSQNEFITAALIRLMSDTLLEDRGGLRLRIENPQQFKPANEDTRAEVTAILAEVAALKIDKRLGFKTGIIELINYLFERLCKENNGEEYTGGGFYEKELAAMRENQKEG